MSHVLYICVQILHIQTSYLITSPGLSYGGMQLLLRSSAWVALEAPTWQLANHWDWKQFDSTYRKDFSTRYCSGYFTNIILQQNGSKAEL